MNNEVNNMLLFGSDAKTSVVEGPECSPQGVS